MDHFQEIGLFRVRETSGLIFLFIMETAGGAKWTISRR
jgi:hypothetical protein